MRGRIMFVAGAGVGYVLGARAGRRRYDQIKAGAEKLWNDPNVQKSVDQVQTFVKDKAPDVQAAVTENASKVVDGAKKTVGRAQKKTGDAATSPSI